MIVVLLDGRCNSETFLHLTSDWTVRCQAQTSAGTPGGGWLSCFQGWLRGSRKGGGTERLESANSLIEPPKDTT